MAQQLLRWGVSVAMEALYQVVVLGRAGDFTSEVISRLYAQMDRLGVRRSRLSVLNEGSADKRDRRFPVVALFVGYEGATDAAHPALAGLNSDSVVIATVVSDLDLATTELPESLRHVNALSADDPASTVDRVASLILEHFRLLRRERRLFISYKRKDAQAVADALYDELDRRGFDVFIDTRSVPPAADFQAELWHRLADSDIVILLDTANFRASRWTMEELARANATNIQVLQVLWPGQPTDDDAASLSTKLELSEGDFLQSAQGTVGEELLPDVLGKICDEVERLRARAMAARYTYLVDGFCDLARDMGLRPQVQPERWISFDAKGQRHVVVPAIGVPRSDVIHQIFDEAAKADAANRTWILFDQRGILGSWLDHLRWLDDHLPARTVSLTAAEDLIGGEL